MRDPHTQFLWDPDNDTVLERGHRVHSYEAFSMTNRVLDASFVETQPALIVTATKRCLYCSVEITRFPIGVVPAVAENFSFPFLDLRPGVVSPPSEIVLAVRLIPPPPADFVFAAG